MIDRETVIKELENYEPYARVFSNITITGSVVLDVLALLKEQENLEKRHEILVNHADTMLAMLKERGWISVNDRLPNCNGCYLVWRPHFYPDKGMSSICYFDGQNTWHDSYGVDFTRTLAPDDVSHWMPLPEQPCKAVKWNG